MNEEPGRLDSLSEMARQVAANDGPERQGRALPSWETFVAARAADDSTRRQRTVLAAALGGIVCIAIAGGAVRGGALWKSGGPPGLTFTLEGAPPGAEGYVPRVLNPHAMLRFSDGTEVTLQRDSRAWVVSTGANGARIRLEEGRARFAVKHRPGARWSVEAGPYTIDVTGTEFDVSWAGGDDLFEVYLVNGAVTVRGPLTGDGIKLRPGQRFKGRVSLGAVGIQQDSAGGSSAPGDPESTAAAVVEPVEAAPLAAPLPAPLPAPSQNGGEATVSRRVRPALALREPRAPAVPGAQRAANRTLEDVGGDWRKLVAHGQFHAVVREAEDAGIDSCLAALPSERLTALADAARYTARTELARRVLVAERKRFSGTAAASDAAFLLGRLAEDTGAPLGSALDWYDRYLQEAPRGSYAAEALGRKMLVLTKLPGAGNSRAVARQYLERYPNGHYVAQARGIVEGAP